MTKLRIILKSNLFYIFLISVALLNIIYFTQIKKYNSKMNINDKYIVGMIKEIDVKEKSISFLLKSKEKIKCTYYFQKKEDIDKFKKLKIGDIVKFDGKIKKPTNNTNVNQFNYKEYLYNHHQYYIFIINSYVLKQESKNLFYKIKNSIYNKLNLDSKENKYIKAFVLGDNTLDSDINLIYRNLGISHLFAVSGMHVSLLIGTFYMFLEKHKVNRFINVCLSIMLLLLYMFLTSFTASIIRSGILFIFIKINKLFNLNFSMVKVFILMLTIITFFNPFIVFDFGFLLSSIISFYLILFSSLIRKSKRYFTKIFITSLISWLVSFPIIIYNFFQINLLSPFFNMICVPMVSLLIFPLSVITLIIPQFKYLLLPLINLLERFCRMTNKINSILIFKKPTLLLVIIYIILITLIFYKWHQKKKSLYILFFIILLIFHYNYNSIFKDNYVIINDVGQGDSSIIHINDETILMDTGGVLNKYSNQNSSLSTTLVNILKSLGIKKIEYMILTHGDYDHMGEAINLVNNFKVENIIFNCGSYNELEKELIKVLEKKKIKYYSCIKELNISNYKLQFLNTGIYDNENDNSSVIYFNYEGNKFLFMGDAGVEKENDILEKYNLKNIDFLKVGHHGSNTSSSVLFINSINPKYSLISVGKNNRYGHPKETVLDTLKNSKIYRTDLDGSIEIKLNKKGYKIKTCPP